MFSLRFSARGVSRYGSDNEIYLQDIKNARVEKRSWHGGRMGVVKPTVISDKTEELGGDAPFLENDGKYYTSADGHTFARLDNRVIVSSNTGGVPTTTEYVNNEVKGIPLIETAVAYPANPDSRFADTPFWHRGYVAIPYDERDQAGAWKWFFSEEVEIGIPINPEEDNDSKIKQTYINLAVNEHVKYVDVYTTGWREHRGLVSTKPIIKDGVHDDYNPSTSMYFVGRIMSFSKSGATGFYNGYIVDTTNINAAETDNTKSWFNASLVQLSDEQNAHSYNDVDGYKGFGGDPLFNDTGVFFYANPTWATKKPQATYYKKGEEGAEMWDVAFQFEYEVKGVTYYGPPLELTDVSRVVIANEQPASAVLVFIKYDEGVIGSLTNSQYRLLERVVPNENGAFVGTLFDTLDTNPTGLTFNGFGDNVPHIGGVVKDVPKTGYNEVTDYIYEHGVVLMSVVNRPMELGFTNFKMPQYEEVLAITPARLSEEERIRSYSMYIMTDRAVYYAQREGNVVGLNKVTDRVGIALSEKDHQPIYTLTHYGVVFVGTDDRLYVLSGRVFDYMDKWATDFRDAFQGAWEQIYDVEYHVKWNELWALTDAGVWVYSLEDNVQGWIAQYNDMPDGSLTKDYDSLYYNDQASEMYLIKDGVGHIIDGTGTKMYPEITTQKILDDTHRAKVASIEVDYDKQGEEDMELIYSFRSNGDNQTIKVPPRRKRYLRLNGHGHVLKFSGFDEWRVAEVDINEVRGNQ